MAYRGKIIRNPNTGQTITFLQTAKDTGGQFLEMESAFDRTSDEPPAHYHPYQDENFTVLRGELAVRANGTVKAYKAGEAFHIPRNLVHSMWNISASPTVVNWQVSPALNTENFFEVVMGLAAEGKTNKQGMPNALLKALLAKKYNKVFRLSKPPFIAQKILFSLLTPFDFLPGYQSSYEKYLN